MTDWYNNYSLPLTIDQDKLNEYINLLKSNVQTNEDDILQNKVEKIENEYLIKLNMLEVECNNEESITNYEKKNSLIILQKELEIIKLLTKYSLQNSILEFKFFIKALLYLYNLSEILRIRIGQTQIIHDLNNNNSISRCSYKFCNYKDLCTYNYNLKNKNQCYQDHYVHRMVSADLIVLIDYIKIKYTDETNINVNKEILKSINTLSYVINHMESELKAKCVYTSDCEKFHFVKT